MSSNYNFKQWMEYDMQPSSAHKQLQLYMCVQM